MAGIAQPFPTIGKLRRKYQTVSHSSHQANPERRRVKRTREVADFATKLATSEPCSTDVLMTTRPLLQLIPAPTLEPHHRLALEPCQRSRSDILASELSLSAAPVYPSRDVCCSYTVSTHSCGHGPRPPGLSSPVLTDIESRKVHASGLSPPRQSPALHAKAAGA